MRISLLLPLLALGAAGCDGNQAGNNTAVAEESSAARIGPGNDATVIDAATGEAADMAADVDYTFNEADVNALADEAEAVANSAGNRSD